MYSIDILDWPLEDDKRTVSNIFPHQTLLEVLLNNKIPIRHDCGGVCHCTTCHVYIESGMEHLNEPFRREEHFLKRCANYRPVSRLACQCLLKEGSGQLEILIPAQKEE